MNATKFRILHDGWEMDNKGWTDAEGIVWTTNHGANVQMSMDELQSKIDETEASLNGLLTARDILFVRTAISDGR